MKASPWHSERHGVKGNCYHDDTRCTEGNNIEKQYRKPGTGGLPKCKHCKELDTK